MQCPTCQLPMQTLKIGEIQVDECPTCRGIWFDKGELEEIKDEVDPDLRFLDIGIWSRDALFNIRKETLRCPRCRDFSMRAINFREPEIDIAFCAACEGVWLNADDFRKILASLSKEAASKSVSDYVRTSLKEGAEFFTHPKRLISEWKDLKAVLRMLRYRVFVENPRFRSILAGIQKSLPL